MSGIRNGGLLVVLCSVACFRFGPTGATFPLASLPNGATVSVQTTRQSATGELLAVRDDGLVILHGPRLALVPYSDLRSARIAELPYSLGAGAPLPEERARLTAVSRYPQGIGTQLQQKLFAQSGQTELEVLR
jgi:hypothetical protein